MGHTQDGLYLCVGNGQGASYVYDALSGGLVTHLRPRKVRETVVLCVGNGQGASYVYDALSGGLVTHLRPRKVRGTVGEAMSWIRCLAPPV